MIDLLILVTTGFVIGCVWAWWRGWHLGLFGFAAFVVWAVALYLSLGLIPSFIPWLGKDGVDFLIKHSIEAGLVVVPFFFGTLCIQFARELRTNGLSGEYKADGSGAKGE